MMLIVDLMHIALCVTMVGHTDSILYLYIIGAREAASILVCKYSQMSYSYIPFHAVSREINFLYVYQISIQTNPDQHELLHHLSIQLYLV